MSVATELGLLGAGIRRSMAPMLHETLGRLTNRDVRYVLHELPESAVDTIPGLLERLSGRGVRGINVTHPFKALVAQLVEIEDPVIRAIGAVNTIRFRSDGHSGHNTDYSGLVQAYRHRFAETVPGTVAQLGAGGFGRAAAFAMAAVGADSIRLYDPDQQRAAALANQVSAATGAIVEICRSAEDAASGADGVLNCSPVGMYLHPGCPVDPAALCGARWVFDAVYVPLRTAFIAHGVRAGAVCMSGSELFFWQGVHAFELFLETTLPREAIEAATVLVEREVARRAALGE